MNDLAIYGKREDVLDLTKRLQSTIPGGRKLTQDEALSLAQLSVAHGLDPFNGEAWIIPGSGLMVGIKGLRKAAKRAAKEEDGVWWTEFINVPASTYDAPENAVVYECRIRDTVTTQAWSKAVNLITTAGVLYKEAVQAAGPAPFVTGIGIATPDEKSKMPLHQRAKKRAEADAIKQRYDVALFAEFGEDEPDIVEAEFEDNGNGKPRDEGTILNELGYPQPEPEPEQEVEVTTDSITVANLDDATAVTEPEPTGPSPSLMPLPTEPQPELLPPSNGDVFDAVVAAGLSVNAHGARAVLQNYCRTGYDTDEKAIAWMRKYRGWKEGHDLTTTEAAAKANAGELPK